MSDPRRPRDASARLDEIFGIFAAHGDDSYGEAVNQIEHAVQSAEIAEAQGAADTLIAAALLHDIGHMIHRDAAAAFHDGRDDAHERLAGKYLAGLFPLAVIRPIEMHVDAKRCLVTTEPAYAAALSAVSRRTLELQGGPMTDAEATAFLADPHAADAIALRRIDEAAKIEGAGRDGVARFRPLLERLALGL
nr:HD domain-containing protein [uncultured Tistrella sp.]